MKEYIFTELGYFTEKECENIKNALDGKTYMHFSITWSNWAGNCTVALSELARK